MGRRCGELTAFPSIQASTEFQHTRSAPILGPPFVVKTRSGIGPCAVGAPSSDITDALLGSGLSTITGNHQNYRCRSSRPSWAAAITIALNDQKIQRWLRAKQWSIAGNVTGGAGEIVFSGTMDPDLGSSATDDQLARY